MSAIERLDYLRDLGVTAIEILPLAEWAGKRNWGYDGVLLMSPSYNYGTPDHLRTLIDACHSRGIAVILDIVFNHLGAVGNVSIRYSPYYFHQERNSPWGSNFDLDGANSAPVRAFSSRCSNIGWRNSESMAFAWTPRTLFTMNQRPT